MKLKEWRTYKEIPVIYGIVNTITCKWYIGSTESFRDRAHRHYYYLKHNNHHSPKLQKSWNKYGEDCFEMIILRKLNSKDKKNKNSIEEEFIKIFNSKDAGYNILDTCRNTSSFTLSEDAIKKVVKAHSKKVVAIDRFSNKVLKTYDSISAASKDVGTSTSNISGVCLGRNRYIKDRVFVYLENYDSNKDYRILQHHMKNVPKSEDWKKKARESNRKAKKVYKYDLQNNLISEYSSRRFAEQENGMNAEYLRKRMGSIINGYVYLYDKIKDIV